MIDCPWCRIATRNAEAVHCAEHSIVVAIGDYWRLMEEDA